MATSFFDLLRLGRHRRARAICEGTPWHDPTGQLRPWRLEYTISEEPGEFAAAVQGLRVLGVAVGACGVRPEVSGELVVVGTVGLPPWLDVPAIEYALRCAGATDVRAVPVRCATARGDEGEGGCPRGDHAA